MRTARNELMNLSEIDVRLERPMNARERNITTRGELSGRTGVSLLVGDDASSVGVGKAALDLVEEVQALQDVLESRVGGAIEQSIPGRRDRSRNLVVRRTLRSPASGRLKSARQRALLLHLKESNDDDFPKISRSTVA